MQKEYRSNLVPIVVALLGMLAFGPATRATEPAGPAAMPDPDGGVPHAAAPTFAPPTRPLDRSAAEAEQPARRLAASTSTSSEELVFVPNPAPNGGTMVNLRGRFLSALNAAGDGKGNVPAEPGPSGKIHSGADAARRGASNPGNRKEQR